MRRNVTDQTKSFARQNRKYPTKAETVLWTELRTLEEKGCKFRRQHCVENYIVDFACISLKLAIEIDGKSHADSENYDISRTNRLQALGWIILRFDNIDVLTNPHSVLRNIFETCEKMSR